MSTPMPPPPPSAGGPPPPPAGGPPPPPPGFAQPQFQGEARNGLGTASLILGILAVLTGLFVVGAVFGLIAVVLGFIGRGRAKRGEATNGGMALAGIITGFIGIVIAIAIIGITALLVSSDGFSDLDDCINEAGNDQAAADRCAEDFVDDIIGG